MKYPITAKDAERLRRDFTYHVSHSDQGVRHGAIRSVGSMVAQTILTFCPPSPERELAIIRLEEAVMWANASISRNEIPPPTQKEASPPDMPIATTPEKKSPGETDG